MGDNPLPEIYEVPESFYQQVPVVIMEHCSAPYFISAFKIIDEQNPKEKHEIFLKITGRRDSDPTQNGEDTMEIDVIDLKQKTGTMKLYTQSVIDQVKTIPLQSVIHLQGTSVLSVEPIHIELAQLCVIARFGAPN